MHRSDTCLYSTAACRVLDSPRLEHRRRHLQRAADAVLSSTSKEGKLMRRLKRQTMRSRYRSVLAALLALLALSALPVASASAAQPEISPTPTEASPITFVGSGGEVAFGNGQTNEHCNATSMEGKFTGPQEVKNVEIAF